MRDIHELIRQRELETVRLQKDIERIQKELEALRLTARLLDDGGEATRAIAASVPAVARETPTYNATSAARPSAAPAATPNTWASAKQFP